MDFRPETISDYATKYSLGLHEAREVLHDFFDPEYGQARYRAPKKRWDSEVEYDALATFAHIMRTEPNPIDREGTRRVWAQRVRFHRKATRARGMNPAALWQKAKVRGQ